MSLSIGKPFKSKIGGRSLINVKLYVIDNGVTTESYYINIDEQTLETSNPQAWIKKDEKWEVREKQNFSSEYEKIKDKE